MSEEQEVAGATKTKPTAAEKAAAQKAKDKERKEAKAAKEKEKAEKAKERAAKKKERDKEKEAKRKEKAQPHKGVIHTIASCIARKEGASKQEILDVLSEAFPDRDLEKMATTVGIQLARLPKQHCIELKKTKDDTEGGRGLVYKAPAALVGMVEKRSVRSGKARSEEAA